MEYRAVTKEDPKKDLTHWKYIKREKVNGKWRYSYDDSKLQKFQQGVTTEVGSRNNRKKTIYEQSDGIFDDKDEYSVETTAGKTTVVTLKQGKLSRLIANGEKWIFDNFLNKKFKASSLKNVQDGKHFVQTYMPREKAQITEKGKNSTTGKWNPKRKKTDYTKKTLPDFSKV